MEKISLNLPPFAPDYSGVCSALFELGGMIVIHDACGCTGNYTGFDEPRWYGSSSGVYCSVLRQIDAILGDDEKLIGRIMEAAAEMLPKFICVTGSPVPMVIGTDFQGIADELEQRTGLPAFGFSTTGLRLYDSGASDAFLALVRRFGKKEETEEKRINLLGLTPLDFYTNGNAEAVCSCFEQAGYTVGTSLAMGASLEEIMTCGRAQANIVVSQSGLAAANDMYERLGIPYVVGLPVGKKPTEELLRLLEQTCRDGKNRMAAPPRPGKQALILGERVISEAIGRCLVQDHGLENAAAVSIFTPNAELTHPGGLHASGEAEIATVMNDGYELVIGDPMFRRLLAPDSRAKFVDFPSPAVSSKLHWNECIPFIGEHIEEFVKRI